MLRTDKVKVALFLMCIVSLGALTYSWLTSREGDACNEDWGQLKVSVQDTYGNVVRDVNVTVWVGHEIISTKLTNNEGETKFSYLPFRCYNLTLEKHGFEAVQSSFCISKHLTCIDLVLLYQYFSLTINVTDYETNLPIPNVSIRVYRYNYAEEYEEWFYITNESGIANFPALEYDEYAIVVSHATYFTYSALTFLDTDRDLPVTLQKVCGPDSGGQPTFPYWMEIAIGIAIGFIVISGVTFYLLQKTRDVRFKKWK
ncbi:MAG: hypothetical protein ACTSRC_18725 [Candidatus Helarchaeota archaeon]